MPDTLRTDDTGPAVTHLKCMLANKRLPGPHYLYGVFGNATRQGTAGRSAVSR